MGSCVSHTKKANLSLTASLAKFDNTGNMKSRIVSLILKIGSMSFNCITKFDQCIKVVNKNMAVFYKVKHTLLEEKLERIRVLVKEFEEAQKKNLKKKDVIEEISKTLDSEITEIENWANELYNMNNDIQGTQKFFEGKSVDIEKIKIDVECLMSKSKTSSSKSL